MVPLSTLQGNGILFEQGESTSFEGHAADEKMEICGCEKAAETTKRRVSEETREMNMSLAAKRTLEARKTLEDADSQEEKKWEELPASADKWPALPEDDWQGERLRQRVGSSNRQKTLPEELRLPR
ncbi:hypothetical protein Efla_003466 [Eimeria flavescens]